MRTFSYAVLFAIIMTTSFASAQGWQQLWNGLPHFYGISAVDTNTCWVCGDWQTVMKTTDAGNYWEWVGNGLSPDQISAIYAKSATLAWVGTGTGKIYKTTDGQNWVNKFSFTGTGGTYINAIHIFDDNTGVAIGDPPLYPNAGPFFIVVTTDGGESWGQIISAIPSVTNQFGLNTSWDVVNDVFWFGSADNTSDTTTQFILCRSTNHGLTWETVNPPSNFGQIGSVSFSDQLHGLISGPYNHTAITTDGGTTWQTRYDGVGLLKFRQGTGTVWGRKGNNIFKSTNYGFTWTDQGEPASMPVYAFSLVSTLSSHVIWACGYNYLLLRSRTDGDPTLVSPLNSEILTPVSVNLEQNYPNPFNPVTTIKYRLQNNGIVRLIIYDATGKNIRTLLNEEQSAGWHFEVWNGMDNNKRAVSTGAYFYQIEINGQMETKKMILLK